MAINKTSTTGNIKHSFRGALFYADCATAAFGAHGRLFDALAVQGNVKTFAFLLFGDA